MSRHINREILINDHPMYRRAAEDRGLSVFTQYSAALIPSPSPADVLNLTTIPHIWKSGDKYYKLASQYYGDPTYWWVIAWFNEKPTDAHLSLGSAVYIPLPLEETLSIYYG